MYKKLKKCLVCGEDREMNGYVCGDCAPRTLFSHHGKKLKYILLLFILTVVAALIFEGLWASGVIVPHTRLHPVRKQHNRPVNTGSGILYKECLSAC